MTKMKAYRVIQSPFWFYLSPFQEKIMVRELFISHETLSGCEWFLDAGLLSLQTRVFLTLESSPGLLSWMQGRWDSCDIASSHTHPQRFWSALGWCEHSLLLEHWASPLSPGPQLLLLLVVDMSQKKTTRRLETMWKGEQEGLGPHTVIPHTLQVQNVTPVCTT